MKLKDFIRSLERKNIHVIGVTGAEGSSILRLLTKYSLKNITTHDFIEKSATEKNFRLWHKGLDESKKYTLYKQFLKDTKKATFYQKDNYLKGIEKADCIFVPQSWRLYPQNKILRKIHKNKIPFYSITRLYLDLAPAIVVGITGTVGKGSVASILVQLLVLAGKKIYFAGHETWRLQLADQLDIMKKEDILVIEISHRQLQDGFSKAPKYVIFTNLYPNHLDEISWQEYKNLKLSLIKRQTDQDISIINYDDKILNAEAQHLQSKIVFFSTENMEKNINSIQNIFTFLMGIKSDHFTSNILASSTAAVSLGLSDQFIKENIGKVRGLRARMQLLESISGVKFYNDIKSTTPWATIAAVKRLPSKAILICGGETKNIDYSHFIKQVKGNLKHIIVLKSQLSDYLSKHYNHDLSVVDSLKEAVDQSYQAAKQGDSIVVSPAAAFFYSKFIRGKSSLRKIITSLLPKEPISKD